MERGNPMRYLLAMILLTGSVALHAETRHLVLVTATPGLEESGLTRREIRKIYLGRPIVKEEQRIIPIINESDPLAYQVFLQRIMIMSAPSYERYLLSRVFRKGGTRPEKTASPRHLLQALHSRPGAVSYMWLREARIDPGLRVIYELWRGELQ